MNHLLQDCENGILRVTINRPERRNALARDTLAELRDVFTGCVERDDLRLAIITGTGDQAFCAGGDLIDLDQTRDPASAEAFALVGTAALDAIRQFPVPTLAVLNGIAIGGGAELAVAADMRIAAAHARIGFVQSSLHISTAWGGGADLARLVGYACATELLSLGEVLDAASAAAAGLVNRVAAQGDLEAHVDAFVAPLREREPGVMRAIKAQVLAERLGIPARDRRSGDQARFVDTWASDAHWRAADAFTRKA